MILFTDALFWGGVALILWTWLGPYVTGEAKQERTTMENVARSQRITIGMYLMGGGLLAEYLIRFAGLA